MISTINGLRLIAEMNNGLQRDILRKPVRLATTKFFAGVAFSPFKQIEAEVMGQFYKMEKKIKAGADFIITQVGYDARKLHEFQMWLKTREIRSRFSRHLCAFLSRGQSHARKQHSRMRRNRQTSEPDCRGYESADKGKQARLDRAAKMFAIVKGMGYKGAYVSGQGLPFESVEYIAGKGNELAANWTDLAAGIRSLAGSWILFLRAGRCDRVEHRGPGTQK